MFDTIAAISSGNINQPISIIRISGPDAFSIIKKIYSGKIGEDKTITYGYIMDGKEMVDEVLVMFFKGSKTFTGEDIVEINAHGGVINTERILSLVLTNGARIAERGEFSRRAFLNGKLDLVKADAIHDLIFAKTKAQAQLSVKKMDGKTTKLIDNLKEKLTYVIATIETNIDYPEYDDVQELTKKELLPKLNDFKHNIEEIVESSNASRYVYEGVSVAIVGKPNAGKSSLLNAILGDDKAIVTDVPGTTRDIVEGSIQVGQVLLKLNDTAGIRKSKDKIESIGINKSLDQIKKSDLVIHVIDSTDSEDDFDMKIKDMSKDKLYIKVYNKSDVIKKSELSISAKNKDISNLLNAISKQFKEINLSDEKIIYNARQISLINSSLIKVDDAIQSLENGTSPDTAIIDIRSAWEDLANISGRANQDDLLDTMFKNFCLGK